MRAPLLWFDSCKRDWTRIVNLLLLLFSFYPLPKCCGYIQMWDEELAAVAQRHAEQCLFEHDCNECRKVGKSHR